MICGSLGIDGSLTAVPFRGAHRAGEASRRLRIWGRDHRIFTESTLILNPRALSRLTRPARFLAGRLQLSGAAAGETTRSAAACMLRWLAEPVKQRFGDRLDWEM